MYELDVLIRSIGCGAVLAVALVAVVHAPRARVSWFFAPLALGLCGFLALNTADGGFEPAGAAWTAASALSGMAALFLWWFCLAVFDDEFRLGRRELGVGAVWTVAAMLDRGLPVAGWEDRGLTWLLVAMAAGMSIDVLWRIATGAEGDLVTGRRRARAVVSTALVTLLASDVAVDLVQGFDWKPLWFSVAQNAAIVVFAFGLAAWMLRPNPAAFDGPSVPAGAPETMPGPLSASDARRSAADERLVRRLLELMEGERAYLDPDLTFAGFVDRLGAPEPVVRRLINGRLGYRHFRSFVNAYRVAAAREALADPRTAEAKIAAIAFDAGFASLASFNRAFKAVEGVAPVDYRRRVMAAARSIAA